MIFFIACVISDNYKVSKRHEEWHSMNDISMVYNNQHDLQTDLTM